MERYPVLYQWGGSTHQQKYLNKHMYKYLLNFLYRYKIWQIKGFYQNVTIIQGKLHKFS